MSDCQSVTASSQWSCSEDLGQEFWQQWEEYRDYLYRCCIKWMGGNPIDAEDALSRAMLKAWENVQKFAGQINNFKGWLTSLTRNLCVDIHRERSRGANRVEDIEGYASGEQSELVGSENTPEKAVETDEKRVVIRRAIDNLSPRLRETFILHFYQDLSYSEIAQRQEISYQNVCKRISQARKILREELRGYFVGEETDAEVVVETDTETSEVSATTESAVEEISQENGGVEPIVGEMVSLSVVVEEVETVSKKLKRKNIYNSKNSGINLRNRLIDGRWRTNSHLMKLKHTVQKRRKSMLKRAIRMFVTLAMLVAVVMTISPQAASAGTCNTYTESNVTQGEWQCIQKYAAEKGFPIKGDKGEESKFTCSVKYDYNPSTNELKFTTASGFFCPVSCSTIDEEAGGYIKDVTTKCEDK